jgi:hypothetical protein
MALGKDGSSGPLRQSLCRELSYALGKEGSSGPLCQYLCRVRWTALGTGSFFAESLDHSTRQRRLYRFPGVPSLPSAMVIALSKYTHSAK